VSEPRLRVHFIHGLESSPQGLKARFFAERFDAVTPAMDTSDYAGAVATQAAALAARPPDVLVGSSFGGAIAVDLLERGAWHGPTLLLAPAAHKLGRVQHLAAGVPVLVVHGTHDDVVPIEDSRALARTGTPSLVRLLEVDDGHRLETLVETGRLAELVHGAAAIGRHDAARPSVPGAFSPDGYARAIAFAARAHGDQRMPGSGAPYVVHLALVAMEVAAAARLDPFDADLAVTCALLHDALEDTPTDAAEIERAFGPAVLAGVRALTKDARLPKADRMADSLARIAREPREIGAVKLADRITNLAPPPAGWSREKRAAYRDEARAILGALGACSAPLAARLEARIEAYAAHVDAGPSDASPAR
jgi:predicted esterase